MVYSATTRTPQQQEKLKDAAMRMLAGLDIKDRKFRFRTHKQCFVGREAVVYMTSKGLAANEDEAVDMGQALLEDGVFHHVTREAGFRNDFLYYRFAAHEETAHASPAASPAGNNSGGGGSNLSNPSSTTEIASLEDRQFGTVLASMKWSQYALTIGALSPICLKVFKTGSNDHLVRETKRALVTLTSLLVDDVHVKNRRLGTKFAKACIRTVLGREVIAWLIARAIAEDELHATQIATLMLREKLLAPITAGEKEVPASAADGNFRSDINAYYRFFVHEKPTELVDSIASSLGGLGEAILLRLRDQVTATKMPKEGIVNLRIVAANMHREINIHDRRWRLRTHRRCFLGCEAVAWLVTEGVVDDEKLAIRVGQAMMDAGIIEHVSKSEPFDNSRVLYRFSADVDRAAAEHHQQQQQQQQHDDGDALEDAGETPQWVRDLSPLNLEHVTVAPGVPASTIPGLVRQSLGVGAKYLKANLPTKNRSYRFKTYKNVFFGKELVAKLIDDGVAESEAHAVKISELLVMDGHVCSVAPEINSFRNDKIPFRFAQDASDEILQDDLDALNGSNVIAGMAGMTESNSFSDLDHDFDQSPSSTGTSTPKNLERSSGSVSSTNSPQLTGKEQSNIFRELICNPTQLRAFQRFLKKDFSDEHIKFWLAVECLRVVEANAVSVFAHLIYDEHVAPGAPHEVNIDSKVRNAVTPRMTAPTREVFDEAQKAVFFLMRKMSYPRFLESEHYGELMRTMRTDRITFAWI
ncbi:hypothetical protein, variant [Capsaspora owczarzaki ATCC 30864]|uniref:hypothetical protein n=1 Tax=Capsaspora owczarzaki (strain ATCC 30864) TaxID=595528 RepID=UPI0001FE378B|nr:hypothetical protein CAOG_04952 [Capsaspora owczarzaki ATCC 30864]XP_011270427.1 hypothetical protein, variant [Capsaspora owczarzaki ATCC 30864]|eukprot:XP_004347703.1 hypothetical protein CAOG_04952 [Capsaspora owczarzaki ATCC 30864]